MSFKLIEKNMIAHSKIELFPKINFFYIDNNFNRFDKIDKSEEIAEYGKFGGLKPHNTVLKKNRVFEISENFEGITLPYLMLTSLRENLQLLEEQGLLDNIELPNIPSDAPLYFDLIKANILNLTNFYENALDTRIQNDNFVNFPQEEKEILKEIFSVWSINAQHGLFNNQNNYEFSTELLNNRYILDNPSLVKKKTYKNTFQFYKENTKYDNYHKLEKGFDNYNTLNFFNINEGDIEQNKRYTNFDVDKTHKNIILYPNIKSEKQELSYNFDGSDDVSLSFYLNPRRKNVKGFHYNPGCIINIPGIISVYLVKGSSIDNRGYTNKFRLFCQFGSQTFESFKETFNLFDIENASAQNHSLAFLSRDNLLKFNNWHSICLTYSQISGNNSSKIKLFIDGKYQDRKVVINKVKGLDNSCIEIGNKFEVTQNNLEDLVAKAFSRSLSNTNDNQGAYINKHILLGDHIDSVFNKTSNPSITHDLKNNLKQSTLDYCDENTSLALNAELHDIRIYNTELDEDHIENICKRGIENLDEEVNSYDLIFYLPVYYKSQNVRKKGLVNLSAPYQKYIDLDDYPDITIDRSHLFLQVDEYLDGEYTEVNGSYQVDPAILSEPDFSVETQNISYNFPINPFFLNYTGGTDSSVEHYLREFVNNTQPNVVIGNHIIEDKYGNCFLTTTSTVLEDQKFNYISKSGKTPHEIFDYIISKDVYNSKKIDSLKIKYQENNILYRNYMILPNDNGIQNQFYKEENFNYLEEELKELHKNSLQLTRFDFVSLENINKNFKRTNAKKYSSLNISEYFEENNVAESESRENYTVEDSPYLAAQSNPLMHVSGTGDSYYNFKENANKLENISISNYFNKYNNSYIHEEDFGLTFNSSTWRSVIDVTTPGGGVSVFSEDLHSNSGFYKTFSNPAQRAYYSSYENAISIKEVYDYKVLDEENQISYKKMIMPLWENISDIFENHSKYFIVPKQQFNKKLVRETIGIKDFSIGKISGLTMTFKDTRLGTLYRCDCLTKHANWASFGNVLYQEGLATLMHPSVFEIGKTNFNFKADSANSLNVFEINLPAHSAETNLSKNSSYIKDLKLDESAFNSDEEFVYITDIDLHDENLNIIATAKLATPFAKKSSDNVLFRLKMDF